MKLKKVISGGQTGADQAGLFAARKLGLQTGGCVPKGWRTEDGPAPWLADYGLTEHASPSYAPRTHVNAKNGDVTVWFGNVGSPGYWCTRSGCKLANRVFVINPPKEIFLALVEKYECMNVAGNRASTNPHVSGLVQQAFSWIPLVGTPAA